MNLGKIFTSKDKDNQAEYFLAVEIHDASIKSAVWQVEDDKTSIVSLGTFELWDSEESLINGVDATLTSATKNLGEEPNRIIFGLPNPWLVDNKIHPSKQPLIKKLISELGLKPIGLVTIAEAISQQLKIEEGIPPSAILLEIYPSKVIVTLLSLGQVQAVEEVGRSDDLSRDVEEGLARFEAEKLPARFILTNGSNLESEEQQIISFPWTDKLPFLHLPKVQALPIDFSIKAIALAGGAEAAKSLGLETDSNLSPDLQKESQEASDSLESLGFQLESLDQHQPPTDHLADISEIESDLHPDQSLEEIAVNSKDKPYKFKFSLPGFNFNLPKFPQGPFSLPRLRFSWLYFLAIVLFLLLPFIVIGYYFNFAKASLTLRLIPQPINQNLSLMLTDLPQEDPSALRIERQSFSAIVSDTISTTGEALVGDKATGSVTLFNKSSEPISLKAGTKITASPGQIFLLDQTVSVASSSSEINLDTGQEIKTFGKTPSPVPVTAIKIGSEHNLAKSTQFNVDQYPKSTLIASAESDFTGGSSRTVKAVAKTDQERLHQLSVEKIKQQIEQNLANLNSDLRLIPVSDLKFNKSKFDKAVGEEAAVLSLELDGSQEFLTYSQEELFRILNGNLNSSGQANRRLVRDQTSTRLNLTSKTDQQPLTADVEVNGLLLPDVNETSLIQAIKGKNLQKIKPLFETINGYQSTKIEISPNLPFLKAYLPIRAENISLKLSLN
ncbi:hypothetical protein HY333_01320 [Candidatus Collierbacteria bacterium]|nr:hypothetical protein [Candidatus Collierbacteria bacterium]